jgi:hypothetical protein
MNINKRASFGQTFMFAANPVWVVITLLFSVWAGHSALSERIDSTLGFSISWVALSALIYVFASRYVVSILLAVYLENKVIRTFGPKTLAKGYEWLENDDGSEFSFESAAADCGEL